MRRGEAFVFIGALIGVPVITAFVVAKAVLDHGFLRGAIPAAIGAALGALIVSLSAFLSGHGKTASVASRRELGPVATSLIIAGALIGTFGSHLPPELSALVSGCALGFFAAFDIALAGCWRRDAAFRARVRAALRGSTI